MRAWNRLVTYTGNLFRFREWKWDGIYPVADNRLEPFGSFSINGKPIRNRHLQHAEKYF